MEKKFLKEAGSKAKDIKKRFKEKDFSGNAGIIIKNSTWHILTTIIGKVGSLIFTILLARILTPEIYGLYGLALSTILIMGTFLDLGVNTALITFLSKTIDKNKSKAKGLLFFLTKIKIGLFFITTILILSLANWISNSYYQKPIFYALLAGIFYHFAIHFYNWFSQVFISKNQFKPNFIKELTSQILRLTILPLLILYLLKSINQKSFLLFWIFIALSFCYLIPAFHQLIFLKLKHPFNKKRPISPTTKEKKEIRKFILPIALTATSGTLFGSVDIVMLGRYLTTDFIAYYQIAFNLITAATAILGFIGVVYLPVLSRLEKQKLERTFNKGKMIIMIPSILTTIFTFTLAKYIIQFTYGQNYLPAINYLKIFSILLITFPLISIYHAYYTAQKKTVLTSIALGTSMVLNIVLNIIFIPLGLKYSPSYSVLGACIATIISRLIYLTIFVVYRKIKAE